MVALTTRQRDLLQLLLNSEAPVGAAELATQMQLTPRQVNYGLKGLSQWLSGRDVALVATPGVGVQLHCSAAQARDLRRELDSKSQFQLILSSEERQQLIALLLLVADEPLIVYQLQQLAEVSRTTILRDLSAMEEWFAEHRLTLERRPNYGVWLRGDEQARRQALAAWLYGETYFEQPLSTVNHVDGLVFALGSDANLLPIVDEARKQIRRFDTQRMLSLVAHAEEQLGGRYTDDAVLYLALAFAVQAVRVREKHFMQLPPATLAWLQASSAWEPAARIARRIGWEQPEAWPAEEVAAVAMAMLAAPRNERWPGDLEIDEAFGELVAALMARIAAAYNLPELLEDRTLHDGIVTQIVPACLRHRFTLWMPSPPPATILSDKHDFEHGLARILSATISDHTGVTLSGGELNNLKLLLRAAYIRTRPNPVQEVWVVCPSGMATAQLLIVRLQARFPRLGEFKVVSMRELNPHKAASAQLIITTVPLPASFTRATKVIQVHPMLLPEDIQAITGWLA